MAVYFEIIIYTSIFLRTQKLVGQLGTRLSAWDSGSTVGGKWGAGWPPCRSAPGTLGRCAGRPYLIDLHSLFGGAGLRVRGPEDPELGLHQGAVGELHAADVEVDRPVVGTGRLRVHGVWAPGEERYT